MEGEWELAREGLREGTSPKVRALGMGRRNRGGWRVSVRDKDTGRLEKEAGARPIRASRRGPGLWPCSLVDTGWPEDQLRGGRREGGRSRGRSPWRAEGRGQAGRGGSGDAEVEENDIRRTPGLQTGERRCRFLGCGREERDMCVGKTPFLPSFIISTFTVSTSHMAMK